MTKKIQAKKRFGQHFLTNQNVIQQTIQAANLTSEDYVVEIGPGRGALTTHLWDTKAHLTVIEIDYDLVAKIRNRFKDADQDRFRLVEGDVLNFDWDELQPESKKPMKLVANLPYNISSPLFFLFAKYRNQFESFTVMVQKEVATRICDDGTGKSKKEYGVLSVIAGNIFDVKWVCEVPPSSFTPPPRVDSAVIQLTPKAVSIENEEVFFKFVQKMFNQRRKILLSYIKKNEPELFGKLSDEIKEKYHNLRPENLSPQDFLELYQSVYPPN